VISERFWIRRVNSNSLIGNAVIPSMVQQPRTDKAKAKKTVAVTKSADLGRLKVELYGFVAKQVGDARTKFKPPQIDATVLEIRNGEIRRMILDQVGDDGLKLKGIISDALEKQNVETLDAILTAPMFWPVAGLIEDRGELEVQRLELSNNELGADAADLIRPEEALVGPFENVEEHLAEFSGKASPDAIGDLAGEDG
jgi:hypothetical protein